MTPSDLVHFLNATLADPEARWSDSGVKQVAQLHVPDLILGRRSPVLRADLHALWARWFLESICDPEPFVENDRGYAFIVKEVDPKIRQLLGDAPEKERLELASQVAQFVAQETKRRREARRVPLDRERRYILLDQFGPSARCWICGHRFAQWAIDRFLGSDNLAPPALPAFVDFVKPSGLMLRDLVIEVDHVTPVARGGREGSNLRLACGWCNSNKSARGSLYDVDGVPIVMRHPRLGRITVPRPFWVVRLLAIHSQCEWNGGGGCDRTTRDAELTVSAWHGSGAMNPSNLRVTCADHHPLGHERLIARSAILKARQNTV